MRYAILFALLALPAAAQAPDPAFANPARFMHRDGAALYAAVCAGCHMPNGRGAQGAGAFPALADNPRLDPPTWLLTVIVQGRHGMPPLGALLDDAQIAAVAAYVRQSFGNAHRDPVTAEEVRAVR
jgi:mono/diheme cytochrome c family protein